MFAPRIAAVTVLALAFPALAQTTPTTFTYQGRLTEAGAPADGAYDMRFRVFNTLASPTGQLGSAICIDNVQVENGLFTVPLDFGVAALAPQAYLQIEVRRDDILANCNSGVYTTLTPRQFLAASPRSAATRGIEVAANGNAGFGGAPPDVGLALWGGVNVRDSENEGVFLLTDELVIANAENEDTVYRYDAPPLDRHTFFSGGTESLSVDSMGRVGIGLETPQAPVHLLSRINQAGFLRLQGSRQVSSGVGVLNGPRTASSVIAGTNNIAVWSNVDSGRVPDGTSAIATATGNTSVSTETPALTFSGFGFAIPADRIIVGITIEVFTNNSIAYPACDPEIVSTSVRVVPRSGGNLGSSFGASTATNAASQAVLGGPGQLFGTTWTPAQINSANFSLDVSASSSCADIINLPLGGSGAFPCPCGPSGQFRIDGVRVTIHTTTTGVGTETFNWSMGYGTGESTFSIAPNADLALPAMSITTDGRIGMGVLPDASTPSSTRLRVAGNIECASLIETSSHRFKTDITPLAGPLDAVLALKPVHFRWDADHGGASDIGFIAEDVANITPEIIALNEAGAAVGMNYGRIGVLAVGAIQELQARHAAEIAALRDDHARAIDALTARLAELEARLAPPAQPRP